jgi:hypothetical protein
MERRKPCHVLTPDPAGLAHAVDEQDGIAVSFVDEVHAAGAERDLVRREGVGLAVEPGRSGHRVLLAAGRASRRFGGAGGVR